MIYVVTATYNEAHNLPKLVEGLEEALEAQDFTLIIVDDNGSDGTAQVARRLGSIYGNIVVHERPAKLGLGSAIRIGLQLALSSGNPEVIVTMDADLSHDPRDVPLLISECINADLVQGSRYIQGGKIIGWPLPRRMISWVANQMCAKLLRTNLHEHTSYFKAYSRRLAETIVKDGKGSGFEFAINAILLAKDYKFKIMEVPVTFVNRSYGKSKLQTSVIIRWFYFFVKIWLYRVLLPKSNGSSNVCDSSLGQVDIGPRRGRHATETAVELWDKHWETSLSQIGIFGWVVSAYRKILLTKEVRHYTDKYFGQSGIFVECGCGTCQSSFKINKGNRKMLGLDISRSALLKARSVYGMDYWVHGDISNMPFRNDSITGIWNLGVMEHFGEDELIDILAEFKRVLKTDSFCLLFWPWRLGPVHLMLEIVETLSRLILREKIQFFPKEYALFRRKKVSLLLNKVGFNRYQFHLSPYGGFVHWVVVVQKQGNA